MARKSKYDRVALKCPECSSKNYFTTRNTTNIKEKLALKKYCKNCKKHTKHTETKAAK